MTAAAWLMLAATWSVVTFFTVRFFLRVLRTPGAGGGGEGEGEGS